MPNPFTDIVKKRIELTKKKEAKLAAPIASDIFRTVRDRTSMYLGAKADVTSDAASVLEAMEASWRGRCRLPDPDKPSSDGAEPADCFETNHLIYAYCLESTKIIEVFAKAIELYARDEGLGVPDRATQAWLETTEALFFRPPPPHSVMALASSARPDIQVIRRNAYVRLFGMDLGYLLKEGRPLPPPPVSAVNKDFVPTFFRFLEECWAGIINRENKSGPNTSSAITMAELATKMYNMFHDRRRWGALEREEFVAVSTLAWFHMAVESNDTAIVKALDAQASTTAQRLKKIADRVGVPVPERNDAFIDLARPLSTLFRCIEAGDYNDAAHAGALFLEAGLANDLEYIISKWHQATGQDAKAAARKL
ncbi:MAG: hypothetical protein AB1918_04645 [Pseudomonadota bacterium]